MGEQAGQSLETGLIYVEASQFERILQLKDHELRAKLFATCARINALYMIARAGSGHIGSSFSSLDILTWLHLEEMQPSDTFFSSKGHDAPGYYAAMIGLGRLPFEQLHQLRRSHGLPGHPDINVPVCATNTGSLGMGISKAKGMLYARSLLEKPGRIFVLTGDGELQEGQIWESLVSAANSHLGNLIAIVDHNKLQSDTFLHLTSDLGDLNAKFAAFGWHVERCDGHDFSAINTVFKHFNEITDKPKVLIADTIKGCGVSFMEHTSFDSDVSTYRFHSGAPDQVSYSKAVVELLATANQLLESTDLGQLTTTHVDMPAKPVALTSPQRLVNAYSRALLDAAKQNPKIVVLDADLILDTGLIPFKEAYPDRFIECGIAEQDMVSQAGGMALEGLLPVVHSFACFLTARPNEQIYNNATEHTRIVYVGSLAGLVPGGPGHSHQAVRDIASLGAIPGLTMLEPSCEAEVSLALDYCLNKAKGPSYLRLVSVPCEVSYSLPVGYRLEVGKGVILRDGNEVVIIGYGPVMLSEGFKAAELLAAEGISVRLVNLPWLNQIDTQWLLETVEDCDFIVTLDNHQIACGQGEYLAAILGMCGNTIPIMQLGLTSVPHHGINDEVLRWHELDAGSIAQMVCEVIHGTEEEAEAI